MIQQKPKKGVGSTKGTRGSMETTRGQQSSDDNSGGKQGQPVAVLHTQQIVTHGQKPKRANGKEKETPCFSFVRAPHCLAFLVTIHLFPSCQQADNQHQSTLTPVSLFFSLLCFSC